MRSAALFGSALHALALGAAAVAGVVPLAVATGRHGVDELEAHGERWRPYRTVASWYLWRALERD